MFLSNYHSHCSFCDGRASMEDFVRFAISKGLKSYGVSSHAPVPFANNWSMNYEDMDEYFQEFYRLKEKYADDIEFFVGLEVDYIPDVVSVESSWIRDCKFDYLVGSIHHLGTFSNGKHWNIDGSFEEFKVGLDAIFGGDCKAAVNRFYQWTIDMINIGGFDIIGHIDKIALNASFVKGFSVKERWYIELFESVLDLIKQKDIIIEINTKAFLSKGVTFPDSCHLPCILERGIPVTVNSDCHYPDRVAEGFEYVYGVLKKCGFKSTRELIGGSWCDVAI